MRHSQDHSILNSSDGLKSLNMGNSIKGPWDTGKFSELLNGDTTTVARMRFLDTPHQGNFSPPALEAHKLFAFNGDLEAMKMSLATLGESSRSQVPAQMRSVDNFDEKDIERMELTEKLNAVLRTRDRLAKQVK